MLIPVPFPVIIPVTFNEDKWVDAPWNVVTPETNNDDKNVEGLLKLGIVGGFKIAL